jgi:hypothetical protein
MWLQNQFVFTLPACGFVVALNLDWCPDASRSAQSSVSSSLELNTRDDKGLVAIWE